LKIALVIDRLEARRGGGEGYAVALARGLVRSGHDVHVLTHYWDNPPSGLRMHPVPMMHYPRWGKTLSLAIAARSITQAESFDIVQGFGGMPWVDVSRPGGGVEQAWLVQDVRARDPGPARWLTALRRRLSPKVWVNRLVEKMVYVRNGRVRIIANSEKVKRDILRYYGQVDPARIHVIRNGVDLDRFHPRRRKEGCRIRAELGLRPDTVVILFLAHNFRLKGLHCLIRALGGASMPMHDWVLLVGGRGNRRTFRDLSNRHELSGRTHFLDQVVFPETLLAACDMLVHPTFYDPFSNVCLEAMAAGVPVITTACNGASELIEDGRSGFVVSDPWSVELLRQRIYSLMNMDRQRMGTEARSTAEHYSWDRHIAAVESIYREIRG
jgi:UDP-glucose:(heptosyl)LPS alpha-1,3-glucosyltransferase